MVRSGGDGREGSLGGLEEEAVPGPLLTELPLLVLTSILDWMPVEAVSSLACTCRSLASLVRERYRLRVALAAPHPTVRTVTNPPPTATPPPATTPATKLPGHPTSLLDTRPVLQLRIQENISQLPGGLPAHPHIAQLNIKYASLKSCKQVVNIGALSKILNCAGN